MLTKCANPECNARFRYLHEGKLFVVDRFDSSQRGLSPELAANESYRLDYYWLCSSCSRSMEVVSGSPTRMQVMPVQRVQPPAPVKKAFTDYEGQGE